MAGLDGTTLAEIRRDFMSDKSAVREEIATLTKADLAAAIAAIDAWIDGNAPSFNSAIPLPARTALSSQQKVDLFLAVLIRRVRG